MEETERHLEEILSFIRQTVDQAGSKGAIIGLSGGIDSALVAALLVRALGRDRVHGLILPCESSDEDIRDAVQLAQALGLSYDIFDLTQTYMAFLQDNGMEKEENLHFANIKPRLRMTTLYFHGGLRGYLVAGTANRSEMVTGYFTKYGDGGVDFEPIADLLKDEVYLMARLFPIPESILEKPPSAGLLQGQTDEQELGFTYEELDSFIRTGEGRQALREKIFSLYRKSRHKTQPPITLDLKRNFYI